MVKQNQVNGKFSLKQKEYVHHGHCHQKAVYGTQAANQLLSLAGGVGKELDTGCCGMAGAFGYEKEHYGLSVKIASQKLIPQVNANKDKCVIANGYSCRHQISDLADGRKATQHDSLRLNRCGNGPARINYAIAMPLEWKSEGEDGLEQPRDPSLGC